MKTSKLLITSLLAAAAMSAPAWAANVTISGTANGTDAISVKTGTAEPTDLTPLDLVYTTSDMTDNAITFDNLSISEGVTVKIYANKPANVTITGSNLSGDGILELNRNNNGTSVYSFYTIASDASLDAFRGAIKLSKVDTTVANTALYLSGSAANATINLSTVKTGMVVSGTNVSIAGLDGVADTSVRSRAAANSGTDSYQGNNDTTARTLTIGGSGMYSFAGSVGSATNQSSLNLTKSGTGTQTLSGTTYLGNLEVSGGKIVLSGTANISGAVSVSNGALDVSSGTHTFGGTFTTGENSVLSLGTVSADSAALAVTGDVTLSAGTIFDVDSLVDGAQLVSSSGTLTAASVTSGVVSGMGIANLYIGGYLANQRGSAVFSVSESGVLTLDSYTASDTNYSLTWNGGDSGVWKANGTGWTTTDTAGEVTFQHGDSVTFGTDTDNNVTIAENLKVGTMTVSAATSFTGTGTVRVDAANLTTTAALTLDENVILDLGSISAATTKTISGTGTVKVATGSNFEGVSLGAGFAGTIEHTGNIDANTFAGNPNAKYVLSSGKMWSGATLINISNDICFANYQIGNNDESTTNVNFTGALTQADGTTLTIGGNANTTATFSGTANLSRVTLSAGTLTISGDGAKSITNLTLSGTGMSVSGNLAVAREISVCKGATVTQSAGTVSATRLVLNDSGDKVASFYTLTGGVLNITGTDRTGGVTEQSTTANAVLIGHWPDDTRTSKLTVSGGTLNVTEGFTVISWDSAGTLEVSGGTANLYGVSLNTFRRNAANVTLSSGRLNLGAGGLTYGSGTNGTTNKTVTLSGGTLGALTDWSSDVAMSLSGNVTIDTTKQVVGADGASANAEGNVGASITLAGALSGDGASLTKAGAGTLTLRGANTYKGGTVIEAGTLVAGSATALGTTKGVEVKSGATLNLGTSAVTVDGLSGAGTVGLAAGTTSSTLTVNSATDSTFSGDLFGAISLVKQGAGTLELSGSNTVVAIPAIGGFDPGVDVQAGTVRVVQTGSNYQSFTNVSVADGATLELSTVLDRTAVDATSVVLSSSAKILVDMSNYASDADVVAVNLISASALSYAGTAIDADNVGTLLGAIELKNWGDGWTQSLSYAGNILSLTLTIPEPSVFGLLAGLGALALAGTRRRRKKA